MPAIGEIRKGRELDYASVGENFIWAECPSCGTKRWVGLRNGQPKYQYCRVCMGKGELGKYHPRERPAKELLADLYWKQGLTAKEIADMLEVGKHTIFRWMQHYEISRHSRSEAKKLSYQKGRSVTHRGSDSPHYKGYRIVNQQGYVLVDCPEHPRAYKGRIFEHLLVWEQTHNKRLPEGWIVHHLNGIKSDNRPANLVGLPGKEHRRLIPIYQQKLRELEGELKQLRRALEDSQMIFYCEN